MGKKKIPEDLHTWVASQLLCIPETDVRSEDRHFGKRLNLIIAFNFDPDLYYDWDEESLEDYWEHLQQVIEVIKNEE